MKILPSHQSGSWSLYFGLFWDPFGRTNGWSRDTICKIPIFEPQTHPPFLGLFGVVWDCLGLFGIVWGSIVKPGNGWTWVYNLMIRNLQPNMGLTIVDPFKNICSSGGSQHQTVGTSTSHANAMQGMHHERRRGTMNHNKTIKPKISQIDEKNHDSIVLAMSHCWNHLQVGCGPFQKSLSLGNKPWWYVRDHGNVNGFQNDVKSQTLGLISKRRKISNIGIYLWFLDYQRKGLPPWAPTLREKKVWTYPLVLGATMHQRGEVGASSTDWNLFLFLGVLGNMVVATRNKYCTQKLNGYNHVLHIG